MSMSTPVSRANVNRVLEDEVVLITPLHGRGDASDGGLGAGDEENVGTTYYNIGVASMAAAVEAARLALEENDGPLTGTMLKNGFEQISEFDAEGLMPLIADRPGLAPELLRPLHNQRSGTLP